MNIQSAASLPASGLTVDLQAKDQQKIGNSCREFEATLWRQMLEKALTPLLTSPQGTGASANGTYTYFLSNAIAERVSGQQNGFSSILQAQLASKAQSAEPNSDPICTKAATP